MDFSTIQNQVIDWLAGHVVQLVITISVLIVYFVLDRISSPKLSESADLGRFSTDAGAEAVRAARIITGVFGLLLLVVVWGIDLTAVLIFASTTITLLGVALFASWSLLSSVTSYFILMLQPSFRRGNFVRVIEADNYVEGYISDLTLFHTKLVTEDREVLIYPNNLILARPCLVNPRDRLLGVGKLSAVPKPDAAEVNMPFDPDVGANPR